MPTPDHIALGVRVNEMAQAAGARAEAARIAGITVQQLRRIINGTSQGPSAIMLARLAEATGYNLHWVVTGKGPRLAGDREPADEPPVAHTRLDPRLMGRLVDAVSRAYGDAGVSLPPLELGVLAAEEYGAHASLAGTEDEQIALAKMVRTKHERRLGIEAIASRKRGA